MRIAALLLLAAIVGTLGVAAYVRSVSSDPARWHVDPLDGTRTGSPNDFLLLPPDMPGGDAVSPVFPVPPEALAARVSTLAAAEPRLDLLAGQIQAGFATFVVRSRLIGWPDYVSVRIVPAGEGGSALAVWSRARFGYSDMGVNEARVRRWVEALGQ
jgi:hypothetical protein